MSLQSGLLSHRYSIRMHVPSPHLCSSAMQALTTGVTERWGGGVKRMQGNQSVLQLHQEGGVGRGDLQGSDPPLQKRERSPGITTPKTRRAIWAIRNRNSWSRIIVRKIIAIGKYGNICDRPAINPPAAGVVERPAFHCAWKPVPTGGTALPGLHLSSPKRRECLMFNIFQASPISSEPAFSCSLLCPRCCFEQSYTSYPLCCRADGHGGSNLCGWLSM